MTAVQAVKANKLSIPQEIVEKLGIAKEDVLAFEVVDEDTLNVRILRKKNYATDPLWKAIHSPVKPKKKVTSEDLEKLEDELWRS
jgi:bifunctional DNA-binding transcriptional regulator/antitoxin component of YhaV-PrlF toxin-antitoxin module